MSHVNVSKRFYFILMTQIIHRRRTAILCIIITVRLDVCDARNFNLITAYCAHGNPCNLIFSYDCTMRVLLWNFRLNHFASNTTRKYPTISMASCSLARQKMNMKLRLKWLPAKIEDFVSSRAESSIDRIGGLQAVHFFICSGKMAIKSVDFHWTE